MMRRHHFSVVVICVAALTACAGGTPSAGDSRTGDSQPSTIDVYVTAEDVTVQTATPSSTPDRAPLIDASIPTAGDALVAEHEVSDDDTADVLYATFVDAAAALGSEACGMRGIVDSLSYGTEIVTSWRTNCGAITCIGQIISYSDQGVDDGTAVTTSADPTDTGWCYIDDVRAAFSSTYQASEYLING